MNVEHCPRCLGTRDEPKATTMDAEPCRLCGGSGIIWHWRWFR